MENIEEKLGTILNNPEMMQQIMAMAQALGNSEAPQQKPAQEARKNEAPVPDLSMLQKLASMPGQGGIDREQRQLLQALTPYLNQDRISKLENAMRAAKLAKVASAFLGNGGLQRITGR